MKKRRLLALLAACVMLLTSCGSPQASNEGSQGSEPSSSETVESGEDTQSAEAEYTGPKDYRGWTTSMATFNPQMYTNSKTFMNLGTFVAMMADKNRENTLEFVPHHASELPTSSDGGTTWNVKIREGLTWSDGTPLDATDYEYTMKMLVDPKLVNKNATYMFEPCVVLNAEAYFKGECAWEDVGVKLINDHELEITLQYPATELDFYTTIGTLIWPVQEEMYEACMNEDRTSTTYGTTLETTPSAGMFTLTEWITDGHDKFVRNALYYGTPRESIAEDVYKLYPAAPYIVSTAIYVGDPISGGEYYRDTEAAKAVTEKYATDPEKAKELFDKAYEANGGTPVSVEYIYFEGQEDEKRQAEILQETFENLFGKDRFTMTLRAMPPSSAYDVYRSGDYDLGLGVRLANEFNPWATMNVWTSDYADKYITGFASEEFDQLQFDCVYGDLVNDEQGRVEALARMEELLLDYGAFVPVMQNDNTVMYSDRVTLATQEYLPFVGYAVNQCDLTAE